MKTLSFDLIVTLFKMKMIVKTNEMKGMIMMSQQDLPTLFYSGKSNSAVPIISESELQTITAEPWLEISKKGLQLEGLNFDRQGQLFLLDVFEGNIFKVNPETKEIKRPFVSHKANPAAIKIHKDGRLFICYLEILNLQEAFLQRQKMVTTYKISLKIYQQNIVLMTWYLILKVGFILQILEDTLPTH